MGTLEHARVTEGDARTVQLQISVSSAAVDRMIRTIVCLLLVGVTALVIWGGTVDYSLRVTSDTPTFLALVNGMGEHPFAKQSPFLSSPGLETQHATPYMQTLAFVWRYLGGAATTPVPLARLLTLIGLAVFGFTLAAVFFYARRLAGSRVAWLTLPVLLGLFGPAHVIWASDLTLHGAMYAGFFPQNLAIGLALFTLMALDGETAWWVLPATILSAATLLVHPLTGVLLCALATVESCRRAVRGELTYLRAPIALAGGFALALLWPAYSIDRALEQTGLRGLYVVSLCAALPCFFRLSPLNRLTALATRRASAMVRYVEQPRATLVLAVVGAAGVAALSVWEWLLIRKPPIDAARLTIYWVDERWRWPLMLAAGTVGLAGLVRLARRGRLVPAVWFGICFAIGAAGALGLPLPIWYRFLLLCQVPLAIGVAVALAAARTSSTSSIVVATLSLALAVKVLTLVALPSTFTYFGSPLQQIWSLGKHIPRDPGLVASDPSTSYFIPAVSGHHVLTFGQAHASSPKDLAVSEDGYQLLHRFWAGGRDWWQAGQEMWRRGVRYVVVEKYTNLTPPTLADFTWRSSLIRTPREREALSTYFYENGRVGTNIYDSSEYVVYRLVRSKLFPGPTN